MNNNLGQRLKEIRRIFNLTQGELAKKLGIKWHKIKDIETGKQKLTAEFAELIEENFSVNMRWLLTGKGEMFLEGDRSNTLHQVDKSSIDTRKDAMLTPCPHTDGKTPPAICEHGFAHIPLVEAELSAGGGSFVTSDNIIAYFAFRLEWIRKKYINPEKAVLMRVRGDSMEPLIDDGDVVLIDQLSNKPKEGKIYAFAVEDAILIKEFLFIPPDTVQLISKNPEYEKITLKTSDIPKLNIIGQVKWLAKDLD